MQNFSMIRATASTHGALFTLKASINGPAVYLDNWALIELAKKDPARRRRFISAVNAGAEVVFSVTNAAELSGPKGASAEAVKSFLNEIGPHWYPAKLNLTEVVELEIKRKDPSDVCVDEHFFKSYVADRIRSLSGKPVSLSDDFFSLAPILDRLGPQRKSISEGSKEFDQMLKNKMSVARDMCKRDPALLDKKFPWVPFDSTRPACFVYFNLLRIMVVEANSLTRNDALDFCHAVVGCAYSNFTTLDTTWKRRIGMLPKPNWLACVYSREELDKMVGDIQAAVAKPGQRKFLILNESIRKKLTGTAAPCRMLETAP